MPGRPTPERIAIVGGSVAGWTLAAALLRLGLGERVTLYDAPPPAGRRLIGGCSLRRAALSHLAAAFERPLESVVDALTGPKGAFTALRTSLGRCDGKGAPLFSSGFPIRERPDVVGVSTRHAHILSVLRSWAVEDGVRVIDERVAGREALGDCLLVNTTPRPELFGGTPRQSPTRYVVAVQVPCTGDPGGLRMPIAEGVAAAPLLHERGRTWLSFFTPFADPASPEATWYGINTTIVSDPTERDALLDAATRSLEAQCAALGLRAHDPDETMARALVGIDGPPPRAEPSGDIHTAACFSPGAPAIYVDGMLGQAAGARALARALATGHEAPREAAIAALRGVRRRNRLAQRLFDVPPALARFSHLRLRGPTTAMLCADW